MTAYNVVNPGSLVSGQLEDISQVLANFNAIATVLNGGIDNANINAAAAIAASKLAGYPADGAKVLKGDGTWGAIGGITTQIVAAANVDAIAPTAPIIKLSGAGGNIRSLGAPASGVGTRVSIENQGSAMTFSNQLAGGTGQQFVTRGQKDVTLQTFESIEFFYNSDNAWYEIARDAGPVAGSMYRQTGSQTIANGTHAKVVLDTVEFDPHGYCDTVNSRFTVPAGRGGLFLAHGGIDWAPNVTGIRMARLLKNGGTDLGRDGRPAVAATNDTNQQVSRICNLAAGDYVELWGYQESGGGLVVGSGPIYQTFLSFTKLA